MRSSSRTGSVFSRVSPESHLDYTEEFEFGLDFILDGLERYRRTIGSGKRSR